MIAEQVVGAEDAASLVILDDQCSRWALAQNVFELATHGLCLVEKPSMARFNNGLCF